MSVAPGKALGVSTTNDEIGTLWHTGSLAGFYGTAPRTKQSVTQQTTKTTTALRADIDRINTALSNLGIYTVT